MTDQTAVVVGVGPGLGLALVKAFATEGYTVFAAARNASALRELSASGERVIPLTSTLPTRSKSTIYSRARRRGRRSLSAFLMQAPSSERTPSIRIPKYSSVVGASAALGDFSSGGLPRD